MPNELAKNGGQAITTFRKKANLTQAKVAEHLGIEPATVSRIETGNISPTLERLEQFSQLFNCPVVTFFRNVTDDADSTAQTLSDMLRPLTKEQRDIVVTLIDNTCAQFCKLNKP
jgi:transcriptional regulator with XRE-family HTH domain